MSQVTEETALPGRLLTAKQVSERLGCSLGNVYGLLESGDLPRVRIGKQKGYRIAESDLVAFIEQRKNSAPSNVSKANIGRALKHIRM